MNASQVIRKTRRSGKLTSNLPCHEEISSLSIRKKPLLDI